MEQSVKRTGLLNLTILLVVGVAGFAAARFSGSIAGLAGVVFVGIGFLVAAVSWFQMRLEENERLEKLEFEELTKSRGAGLFESNDAEISPARKTREQFERFFIPVFATLLFLAEAGVAVWLWRGFAKMSVTPVKLPLLAAGFFFGFFLVLFMIGKYSANLARFERQRLLRPGAGYLLLCAYLCFLVTGGAVATLAEFPQVDLYLAKGLVGLLALIAFESLINLILELYRPRIRGKEVRPVYESRLVGLLGQPEGLFTTAAHAIDYQFGFKVSDTWFYRFLERWLGWLVLVQAAVLWISTSVVFIEPGEQGLLERFGKPLPKRATLNPGPHLKLPWPVEKVYRFFTTEVQTVNVGFVESNTATLSDKVILWTVSHYKEEFNLLVASHDRGTTNSADQAVPVNLLSASIPVQYQIKDVRAWAYDYSNPRALLEQLATREVVHYLVSVDMLDIMSAGRERAANALRQRIQTRADELGLGVNILFVGLQDIHPPVAVAPAYEAVNAASQEVQAKILKAEGEASKLVLLAQAEAQEKIVNARGDAFRRVSRSEAQAKRFADQIAAYQAAPSVYQQRLYLQTLASASAGARKYVIAPTNTQDMIQLNLEDKLRPDLLDISVPERK